MSLINLQKCKKISEGQEHYKSHNTGEWFIKSYTATLLNSTYSLRNDHNRTLSLLNHMRSKTNEMVASI